MSPDPSPADDPDRGLDVDARFAEIIAGWEPSPPEVEDETSKDAAEPDPTAGQPPVPDEPAPEAPPAERLKSLFQPSWNDPLETEATWEDEGHFVPPVPPPLPSVEPRRRIAWIALLGSPVVGLLLVLLQVSLPRWMSSLLVCAFVGGFCYLVATMGQPSRGDWSGDDGAVL